MKNIIERDILSPPSQYEAYLYRYTNLENGKVYVGIHKGAVNDDYKHSSTCKEFAEVFNNQKSKLKFEVLQYGSYLEMRTAEHSILSKDDARNNPNYYNKTNGTAGFVEPREDMIQLFVEQILDGAFQSNEEDISLHVKMPYLQVRFEHNAELQRAIKEAIDDLNGNTDNCNPLIVLEGRGKKGGDIRIDGNTTLLGASQSKHATKIPVIRIPYDSHKHLTDFEVSRVGRLLNRKPEIEKKPNYKKYAIKDVQEGYENGIPVSAPSNVSMLKLYGFTTGAIRRILKESKQLIEKDEALKNNQLFINYKASPHSQTLSDTTTGFGRKDGWCSTFMSSASFRLDRVLETLYANSKEVTGGKLDNKKIMVVIHHPTVEDGNKWKSDTQSTCMKRIKKLINSDYEIHFHEMTMWQVDNTEEEKEVVNG